MSDLFAPFTTPSPPSALKSRVLAAAAPGSRTVRPTASGPLGWLDVLWSSRSWWLGWSAAMVLLALLATGPRQADREVFTAESWQRYRASLRVAMGGVEIATVEPSGGSPGGAA